MENGAKLWRNQRHHKITIILVKNKKKINKISYSKSKNKTTIINKENILEIKRFQ